MTYNFGKYIRWQDVITEEDYKMDANKQKSLDLAMKQIDKLSEKAR